MSCGNSQFVQNKGIQDKKKDIQDKKLTFIPKPKINTSG